MTKEQALSTASNFLKHIYDQDFMLVADILAIEADEDYKQMIKRLEEVKSYINTLITAIKEDGK